MTTYYHRDGTEATLTEFAHMTEQDRRVALAKLGGGVEVSTVFLGIDHNFGFDVAPILFETMIFGGDHDQQMDRYSTETEAIAEPADTDGQPFLHGSLRIEQVA